MFRTVITVSNDILSLRIPKRYIGKLIEIIAFPLNDATKLDVEIKEGKKKHFTIFKVKDKTFKFDRNEANQR